VVSHAKSAATPISLAERIPGTATGGLAGYRRLVAAAPVAATLCGPC
jgi:hypothetical protein